ncbi:MAG TPA: AAA family ATPase [Ktedonobacteraceae bacterium]|nr:AAA family ATPase [Ktedonobacteraceae bacterium]HLI88560.1 AAA family ATPase [Ktedonobacteraceae bacterium]
MSTKVFVLGRPGSGKSTAAHHIMQTLGTYNITTARMDDFTILSEMCESDSTHMLFRPIDRGGFDVLDASVLDLALAQLETQAVARMAYEHIEVVILEFARADYRAALSNFSRAFLQSACFLFVNADADTCKARICQRALHPRGPDDHPVSEEVLERYYATDNSEDMVESLKEAYGHEQHIRMIKNNGTLSLLEFLDSVDDFTRAILAGVSAPFAREIMSVPASRFDAM